MKTAKDPRHIQRREAVKILFAESFTAQNEKNKLVLDVLEQKQVIDTKIQKAATQWPIDELNKIDLAILFS